MCTLLRQYYESLILGGMLYSLCSDVIHPNNEADDLIPNPNPHPFEMPGALRNFLCSHGSSKDDSFCVLK